MSTTADSLSEQIQNFLMVIVLAMNAKMVIILAITAMSINNLVAIFFVITFVNSLTTTVCALALARGANSNCFSQMSGTIFQ